MVFLDEMTTGLDPAGRREVWRLVEQIRREGTTVILVTHFMDEAERLCDRLAILRHGRVLAEGTPADLVDRYGGGVRVSLTADQIDATRLGRAVGASQTRRRAGEIQLRGDGALLTRLGHTLTTWGYGQVELRVHRGSLEDAYVRLVSADGPDGDGPDGGQPHRPGRSS
jgi:ABC-2 type transport system ATP-binding protein